MNTAIIFNMNFHQIPDNILVIDLKTVPQNSVQQVGKLSFSLPNS